MMAIFDIYLIPAVIISGAAFSAGSQEVNLIRQLLKPRGSERKAAAVIGSHASYNF